MKRLLFIDQYGEMGGGQRVLISLLRAARDTGGNVSVLAPGGGALETAIKGEFGNRVTFVHCDEPRITHGRKGIRDILALVAYGLRFRRHRPLLAEQDVIYVNGLRHLPHILLLARGLTAQLIYHVHIGHSQLERTLLRLAERAKSTCALVVNSRFIRDSLGISSPRIRLVENALDGGFAAQPFSDRFTGAPGWTAATVGTLRPEKGQDIAIEAVSGLGDMELHVIGRNGEGVSDWIAALKRAAPPAVIFDGPVTDTAGTLHALGIQFNLVPSRWDEPFGLVAIEGMASSCLTIVSGKGGLAEIAEHTGALVAPDAASLQKLLAELRGRPPEALVQLARTQHSRTIARYAPERFAREVTALLLEAANNAAKRR